jgi:glutamate-5-semialdehyde dehydrogenase
MKGIIDLMIPRGGAELIKLVSENATMPVVTGGIGVCHTYVDKSADLNKAVAIAYNAKVQRPTVCNALDCILVHNQIAQAYLPAIAKEWAKAGVEMHCDKQAMAILKECHCEGPARQGLARLPESLACWSHTASRYGEQAGGSEATSPSLKLVPATDKDWGKEYLSLKAAIKVVNSLDEALEHIEKYGSGHSEAIVTEDHTAAVRFLNEVDAACVYANASTRFTDGGQFGLGAEIGISTQKFHARGPMALKELTSYKWIIWGSGQVRP